jgi:hypothetical protein
MQAKSRSVSDVFRAWEIDTGQNSIWPNIKQCLTLSDQETTFDPSMDPTTTKFPRFSAWSSLACCSLFMSKPAGRPMTWLNRKLTSLKTAIILSVEVERITAKLEF